MNLFVRQFTILLWKCWLLKRRHYVATFFEFFLPLLTSITMVITVSSFKSDRIKNAKLDTGYQNGPTVYNVSSFDLMRNLNFLNQIDFDVYYMIAPENACTERFMGTFDGELRSRLLSPPANLHYLKFKNKEELEIYFSKVKGRFLNQNRLISFTNL